MTSMPEVNQSEHKLDYYEDYPHVSHGEGLWW